MEKKPWYKSKITLLAIVMGTIGASDLAFGWVSGNGVTPDQIQAVQTALPDVVGDVKSAVEAKNYFGVLNAVGGYLIAIWRVWFTDTKIG